MPPTSPQAILAPNEVEGFQHGGDHCEAEEEPVSSSEVESQSQSAEHDDESGGEEELQDTSEGQPESAEDRESSGGGKYSTAKFTSAKDDVESDYERTANRAKEDKHEPVRLEMSGASAPALSFSEKQSPVSSGESSAASEEGTATSREGAESQEGDTMSSADSPSSFLPLPGSGGG